MSNFPISDLIIQKLLTDTPLDFHEKAYVEKAIKSMEYCDNLINQAIGLEENRDNLQFISPVNKKSHKS